MKKLGRTASEACGLLVLSTGLAFAANSLRTSRSIQFDKNYFDTGAGRVRQILEQRRADAQPVLPGDRPQGSSTPEAGDVPSEGATPRAAEFGFGEPPAASREPVNAAPSSHSTTPTAQRERDDQGTPSGAKSIDHPYQEIAFHDVVQLVNDPKYEQGLLVVVDARNRKEFMEGHIRGAIQADHYELKDYVDLLSARALPADKVVVYCNGGDCEDSVFMCGDLLELGLEYDRIYLYPGGWEEWQERADGDLIATGSGGGR